MTITHVCSLITARIARASLSTRVFLAAVGVSLIAAVSLAMIIVSRLEVLMGRAAAQAQVIDEVRPLVWGTAATCFALVVLSLYAVVWGAGAVIARQQAEREALIRQTAAAEVRAVRELDRLQTEFLQTISHEIRTPLTLVHGYAELLHLRSDSLDRLAVKRMTEQILLGSSQLTRLAEDLIEFARLERGELSVQSEEIDLVPVLCQVAKVIDRRPGGDRLVLQLPEHLPVLGDPDRVGQMVLNLVDNALKYAPQGPITARVTRVTRAVEARFGAAPYSAGTEMAPAPEMVRVTVEDCGPGITQEDQPRVWEKFFRGADVAGLNVARGSGIG
ncbi:MAG: HAMP domain-containing histidine kinase, partial [Chloroflexota bacterium]|nr:HAMP domain-containing histidine kinase [Chloroflexota bacterium]